ncbi:hypothetical protein NL43_05445 [Methanosphaera sp. WGK6]|nr:hypothetical protein NL43_05445 [Methanosphaera sp. WGK6]
MGPETKANIFNNSVLKAYFIDEGIHENNSLMKYISETSNGSIVYVTGAGMFNLMLVAGVHGDELAPQLALTKFMGELIENKWNLNCKLYIVPFLIPQATMENSRYFNFRDMNRYAGKSGITRKLVDFANKNSINALCDCHSTDPSKKPGFTSVFCSMQPMIESTLIARYICMNTNSRIISINTAGSVIKGSVEDESNIRGIASVTCECVSPVCEIAQGSVEESYEQVISFLKYFHAINRRK